MRRSLAMPGLILGCAAWVMSGAVPGIVAGADESVDALKRQLAEMQESMDELKKGSFHLRSAELGIAAEVDPYARAHAFIVGTEDGIEVEEAAITTTSLPYNLTGQAGRFFAAFGRLAQFHQHEFPFVNTPLSINRMVGGEALATGTQWTWLLPTPFFLSLSGGVYNDIGHTHGHAEGEPAHEDEHEGEHDETVLRGIDLEVHAGEFVGLGSQRVRQDHPPPVHAGPPAAHQRTGGKGGSPFPRRLRPPKRGPRPLLPVARG